MGKIINTLKNGTGKAKLVIILAFLSCLAAVGFIVIAIALKQLLYFFGTVICSFIAISLKQTLDVYEYQGELYGDGKMPEVPKEDSETEEFPDFYGEEEALDSNVTEEEKPEEKKEENKKDKKAKKKDKKKKVKEPKPKKDKKNSKKISKKKQDEEQDEEQDETLLDEPVDEELSNHEPQDEEIEAVEQEYDEQEYEEENDEQENTDDEMEDEDVNSLLDKMNNLLDAADVDYNDEDMNMDELDEIISESGDKEETSNKHKHKHHKEKTQKEKVKKEKVKKEKIKRFGKKNEVEEEPKKEETPDKGVIQENMLEDELEKDLKFLKTNIAGNFGDVDDKDEGSEDSEDKKKLRIVKPVSEDEAASYDRSKIKKTLHKYKVKKDHRLILIDHCDKYYIEQTPAYIWVSDKEFNLLLIEEEPRHLVLPLYGIKEITYLKKCPVNSDTDYPLFHKKNLLTDTFRPYLPDYTQSTVMTDLTSYKNLYGFGPGIYCTNRSAKNLFDLLSVEFRVDDKVTMSNKVNIYFKECYKAGILLRDSVIDANGYADSISRTLDDMAKSTISNNEFKETLNLLVRNKIITKEFSNHYMDVRDKMRFS